MYGHRYTEEQDEFIRNNYTNVSKCTALFNQKYGTHLRYSAIKAHANRMLGLKTGRFAWTPEYRKRIAELVIGHSYSEATQLFNLEFGTNFSKDKVENFCTSQGIHTGLFAPPLDCWRCPVRCWSICLHRRQRGRWFSTAKVD